MRFLQHFAGRQKQARGQEIWARPACFMAAGRCEKQGVIASRRGGDRHDDDDGRRDGDDGIRSRSGRRGRAAGS